MAFNLSKYSGRKRIKDRGINWEEFYKEKSKTLKKRFDKNIGPGSYYRWQGHDYSTDSNYYIVVGPTIQRDLGKCFFAGIKKLPNDPKKKVYSPDGEYFTNIRSALSFATDKWGCPFPENQIDYDQSNLANTNISEHIKGSSERIIKEGQLTNEQVLRKSRPGFYAVPNGEYPEDFGPFATQYEAEQSQGLNEDYILYKVSPDLKNPQEMIVHNLSEQNINISPMGDIAARDSF